MSKKAIAYEMARRKVQFHKNEKWNTINLWGLFRYGYIKRALEKGYLINHLGYKPENRLYWVIPSKEFWESDIKPLITKHTLKELTALAGW